MSSDDGYLYKKITLDSDDGELRWKDEEGNVYRNPSLEILPVSLGGKRDPAIFGLVEGKNGWEPCLLEDIENETIIEETIKDEVIKVKEEVMSQD